MYFSSYHQIRNPADFNLEHDISLKYTGLLYLYLGATVPHRPLTRRNI